LSATIADAATCEGVVADINKWYLDTRSECGIDPAVDCSGVMIRATHRWDEKTGNPEKIPEPTDPLKYYVWNPSPNSVASGGVSVSWMRADHIAYKDPGLGTANGMILTPRQFVSDRDKKLNVFCAFPIDAWTDYRAARGCLDYSKSPEEEKSCQTLGINDGVAWKQHFEGIRADNDIARNQRQCGFDMNGSMEREARTEAFRDFIAARKLIAPTAHAQNTQTELRMVTWDKDNVPVAAFFYSEASGKKDAMKNQFDYYQQTGRWVPVVRFDFPQTFDSKAKFSCEAGAQHRDLPRPVRKQSSEKYIEKAVWIKRDLDPHLGNGVWSLSVTPTAHGRTIGADETEAMYAELLRAYGDDPRWSGDRYGGGMRRQLVCHLTGVSTLGPIRKKSVYNLEPVRPDATHAQAQAQECNVWEKPLKPYL
jgi:hypothetical protein